MNWISITIIQRLLQSFFLILVFYNTGISQVSGPAINCPEENVINICAPVTTPATYALDYFMKDVSSSDINMEVEQTVSTLTDLTIITHHYTFTDQAGNQNTCQLVYNILNRFLQAPVIRDQSPICKGDLFSGVKLGAGNYRVYADDEGSPGELLGLCDEPGLLCAAQKIGVDGSTVSVNQVWVTNAIIFPDGSTCESPASSLTIEVFEKPEARLSASSASTFVGSVTDLMSFVEENETGYWTGNDLSSVTGADGKTNWLFTALEPGLNKLFYNVKNEVCSQSYTFIIEVLNVPPPPPPYYDYDAADIILLGGVGPAGPGGAPGPGGFPGTSSADGAPPPGSGAPPPPPPPIDEPYPPYPYTQPDAGLVTAGEWSDLNNWEFLDTLLNENEYYEMPNYWSFHPTYRVSVLVKNEDEAPVIDALVELTDADNEVAWTAKTDNNGRAELWPALYSNDTIDISTYSLSLEGEPIISNVILYEDGINEIIINDRPSDVNLVELSFIVDATGSMSDELEFLKQDLRDVIRTVEDTTSNLDIYTSTVFYRDEGDAYVVRQSDFTNDIDITLDFIRNQSAMGGGDFPEAVHTALDTCINNLQWSNDAKARIAFLLLDAPPHYTDEIVGDIQTTIRTASAKGIKVIPITASGIDKETEFLMRFLAMATNGTYTFITNDSGIGNDHIEPSIGDFDVEYLNDLMVRLILRYTQ